MSQTAINQATRRANRTRILGEDAQCERCGWADMTALTQRENGRVLCYECRCAEAGRATMEDHHILGTDNDPATVPVPGNLHRGLSEVQQDWPQELRRNPDRDPLIWLAQACRGLGDHLAWWVKVLAAVGDWLLALAAALRREHGTAWWDVLGIPRFWAAAAT